MDGYTGNILRVKLQRGETKVEPLNMEWAEKYFGGKGLGIKYLYEELNAGIDPLSEANKMILMTGPLTGTIVPCSGKLAIITKSPATNTILDCSIGGHFAGELKYAGYDAVILEGKADNLSYILIEDDHVEIKDASRFKGWGSFETEKKLKELHGSDSKVLSIGLAGENLVPMACINSELYRQAARGGVGAVMGSKKIKAVVVKGSKGVKLKNTGKIMEKVFDVLKNETLTEDNLWAYTDGTPILVKLMNAGGLLPTKNYQDGTFTGSDNISTDAVAKVTKGKKGCLSCALGCGTFVNTGNTAVEGPEYETLSMCGSNCGIDDLEAVVEFNRLCDDWGVDTISCGNTIAFAMEMTEKGIKDFGITFGDVEKYLELPEKIAKKEGIGFELSQGVKALSEKYGGKEFAMHVKGLEFPGYDPRGSWGMAVAYAVSDRGACHLRAWTVDPEILGDLEPCTTEGKGKLVAEMEWENAVKFSLILCDFWAVSLETMAEIVSLVLDKDISAEELNKSGKRIVNLARMFNINEGFSKKDDRLPERIYKEALKSGPTKGNVITLEDFNKMLYEYYKVNGWDEEGKPIKIKLEELLI